MKIAEKIKTLQDNHFSEWMKTRKEVEDDISNRQPMYCICGRIATGLHEMNCRKFINTVNSKTVERLKHLIK